MSEKTKTYILTPLKGRASQLKLRDKIVKILPKKLAKTFPRTLEPLTLLEWAGQIFQQQGASFYGKLLVIVLSTYFLADLTSLLAEKLIPEPPTSRLSRTNGTPPKTQTLEDYQIIFARNLFNSQGVIPGEEAIKKDGPVDLNSPPVKTSLPLNLIGTLILKDELKSIATLEDKSAATVYPVRIEDEIPSKAKILKIESRKVIFLNISSNRREYVDLPEDPLSINPKVTIQKSKSTGVEQVSPTQFNIAKTEVDKALGNLNEILTQARCIPNFEGGAPVGFKCFQIVPGSIYDKLGLINGDVLTGINGQTLNDPGQAFAMLSELKNNAKHLELTIKRDGKPQTLVYDIQ